MPADQSLAYYWASIGFSAAGVLAFLWLLRTPASRGPGIGNRKSGIDPKRPPSSDPPAKLGSKN